MRGALIPSGSAKVTIPRGAGVMRYGWLHRIRTGHNLHTHALTLDNFLHLSCMAAIASITVSRSAAMVRADEAPSAGAVVAETGLSLSALPPGAAAISSCNQPVQQSVS